MIKGLTHAARSMNLNDKRIGSLANNLANLDSTGYKREIPFDQILTEGGEVKLNQVYNFDQGELIETFNPLDIALKGEVFFMVEREGELLFTRNGNFNLSRDGHLIDNNGDRVMGEAGPVTLESELWGNSDKISVTKSGEVYVGDNYIDKLALAKISDLKGLLKAGNNNFKLGSGEFEEVTNDDYQVLQGYLENSNVNPVMEMEEMIRISTQYESAQKIVKYFDETLEKANEIGRL